METRPPTTRCSASTAFGVPGKGYRRMSEKPLMRSGSAFEREPDASHNSTNWDSDKRSARGFALDTVESRRERAKLAPRAASRFWTGLLWEDSGTTSWFMNGLNRQAGLRPTTSERIAIGEQQQSSMGPSVRQTLNRFGLAECGIQQKFRDTLISKPASLNGRVYSLRLGMWDSSPFLGNPSLTLLRNKGKYLFISIMIVCPPGRRRAKISCDSS